MSNLDLELRRLADDLKTRSQHQATTAASGVAGEAAAAAATAVDAHADQRQFVHGVGPLYVAKTTRADQFVDWKDLRGTPPPLGGGLDPETLELDGSQITTGTVNLLRLPAAGPGEVSSTKLVRADDPRLASQGGTRVQTVEYLAAGDFVQVSMEGGAARVRRADATQPQAGGATGFVAEAVGQNEWATVFPQGTNAWCYLPGVSAADLGKLVYLSTTPGKVSLSPPSAPGQLIQVLGTVVGIGSSTVAHILVRYEFRFRL